MEHVPTDDVWNTATNAFTYDPTFAQIASPILESKKELVLSSGRNSADSYSWGIYQYQENQFVCIALLTEEYDSLQQIWNVKDERYVNGEWKTSFEGEITEDITQYYANDGYWNLQDARWSNVGKL